MLYCRRTLGRVREKIKEVFNKDAKTQTVTQPDGGRVTYAGIKWLAKRSRQFEKEFTRAGTAAIRTNISCHQSAALKTLCRDRYLGIVLESGTYNFDHIFVIRNPYGEAPLTALALFQTSEPCAVRVTVKGDHETEDYTSEVPPARLHRVPILGLYAGRENIVQLQLLDKNGGLLRERTILVPTKNLPSYMRDLIDIKKMSKDPAFKNILISGGLDINTCAFDRTGQIRYYLRRPVKGYGVFPLAGGRFYFMEKRVSRPTYTNPTAVQGHDMDYMGRVFKTYFSEKGIHHTVEEKTPGGNLLVGTGTMEGHTEDLVEEWDRETGRVVHSIRIDQILDDTYIDWVDWAHVNSAAYYKEDDSILISLRNIHSVVCVDYTSKKLRWMLAPPDFWEGSGMVPFLLKPEGDMRWIYQQHAAFFLDREEGDDPHVRRMIVYDNHWAKRRKSEGFDGDKQSYVSFYEINEKEMTVRLDRSFGHRKARIRSNGLYCPEERRVYSMAGMYAKPFEEKYWGGIYEFDYDTGKCLTRLYVKPGFFRAYDFTPDAAKLAEPIQYDPKTEDYFCGNLQRPERLSDKEAADIDFGRCTRKLLSGEDVFLEEDVLFVYGVDHDVHKIYLVGKKGVYRAIFDDTEQTMPKVFGDAYYHVCIWLDELPRDQYKLVLDIKGELQSTGKWIEKI